MVVSEVSFTLVFPSLARGLTYTDYINTWELVPISLLHGLSMSKDVLFGISG